MEVRLNQEISQARFLEYIVIRPKPYEPPTHLNYPVKLIKCFRSTFVDDGEDAAPEWSNATGDWVKSDGDYYSQSPSAITDPLNSLAITALPDQLDDFVLYVKVNFFDAGGILLRSTGKSGMLLLFNEGNISFRKLDGLNKISDENDVAIATSMYSDEFYEQHLKIVVTGSKYEVFIKDANEPFLSVIDTEYTSGAVALIALSSVRFGEIELKPSMKAQGDRSECFVQRPDILINRDLMDPSLASSADGVAKQIFLDKRAFNVFKVQRDVLVEVEYTAAVKPRDVVVFIDKVFDDRGTLAMIANHVISSSKILPMRINEDSVR